MFESMNWDSLCEDFSAGYQQGAALSSAHPPPAIAAEHAQNPADEDIRWLVKALKDDRRKWFVAHVMKSALPLSGVFFIPLLDAGIDETNPSFNKLFIWPCTGVFGRKRVNEYLLEVIESGTDFRKAGAVNALYWAQMPVSYSAEFLCFDSVEETREAEKALAGLWERKRKLLLETFVANPNVDVRRSIIPSLRLDPTVYPAHLQPLVPQAIAIARSSSDEYIRHRVEVQLGTAKLFAPLPHRKK